MPRGRVRPPRASAVPSIHAGLVGERKLIGTPYLATPSLREAYAREIAPRTEAALARVLDEIYGSRGAGTTGAAAPSAAASPLRIVPPPARAIDLGAGTGAVGRTLRSRFGAALPVVAVDLVPGPDTVRADLAAELPAVGGRFDLVVAAHLLNELYVDRPPTERIDLRARRVLAWAAALLSSGGRLIVLEPALRQTSRELLAVRDQVLAAGLQVVAPCLWTGPCPALARDRDWCHDAAPIAHGARVDYAYLVLRARDPEGAGADDRAIGGAGDQSLFRIVSDPMVEKGRLRLFGCGPAGRHPLVRLDRHTSPSNAPFDVLHRGSLTRLAPTDLFGDGLRLSVETVVEVVGG
jgi:Mitochondrial small ribosomal subunit Rsm22